MFGISSAVSKIFNKKMKEEDWLLWVKRKDLEVF
jgi:hypothetical protein